MSPVPGIAGLSGLSGVGGVTDLGGVAGPGGAAGLVGSAGTGGQDDSVIGSLPDSDQLVVGAAGRVDLAGMAPSAPSFAQALDRVASVETHANALGLDMVSGGQTSAFEFTAAAAEARLMVQTATAVRNRALEAFSEVMHMQV